MMMQVIIVHIHMDMWLMNGIIMRRFMKVIFHYITRFHIDFPMTCRFLKIHIRLRGIRILMVHVGRLHRWDLLNLI